MSPIPRMTKLTVSTAPAIPEAALAKGLSCAVTAATAAKTHPRVPMPIVNRRVDDSGSGAASEKWKTAAMHALSRRFMNTVSTRAAMSWVCRPVTFARTSSARPVCSSVRVCLEIVRIDIRAAPSMRKTPYMPTTNRGTVASSRP